MTRKERNNIINWANTLSDDDLKKQYYDCADGCLGTLTDKMYELGYDMSDIVERQEYEEFMRQKADLLCMLCEERNIELWV